VASGDRELAFGAVARMDRALQMSEQAVRVGGGLVVCFASLGVSSGSMAVGIKNGCFSNWKESPHFTKPNSMERKIL